MCIEEFNRYQIKKPARGRFAWIELHNDDHDVPPLTEEDMASFSALVQELGLTEWNHKIDRDVLDTIEQTWTEVSNDEKIANPGSLPADAGSLHTRIGRIHRLEL